MENKEQLLEQARTAYETGLKMCRTFQESDPDFARPLGQELPEQYRTEVLSYLLYLSEVTGEISPARASFIDGVLGYPYTADELSELMRRLQLHEQEFGSLIPTCLKASIRYDSKSRGQNAALTMIRVFDRLGDYMRQYAANNNAMEELDQRIYILSLNNWARDHGMRTTPTVFTPVDQQKREEPPVFIPKDEEQPEPSKPAKSLEELMEELNALVGLEKVKEDVSSLVNLLKIRKLRKERNMADIDVSMHLVFTGNPGTGKTTVARLLSQIYHALGALSKGQLIEVERSDLVGGYVGQTAIKTSEVIEKALGGVLFIDEAYSLTSGKDKADFGHEAVNTLLVEMENHRDDLVVIVAGYPKLMEEFLKSNPGLKSRFNKFIAFDDYKPEELFAILEGMIKKNGYTLAKEDEQPVRDMLKTIFDARDEDFANGRSVRNFFEKAIVRQANRLARETEITNEELAALIPADFSDELAKKFEEVSKKHPQEPSDAKADDSFEKDESSKETGIQEANCRELVKVKPALPMLPDEKDF